MPVFLSLGEVLELHDRSIQQFGGSPGVRDKALLESALGAPQPGFGGQYLHDTLAAMAAAYSARGVWRELSASLDRH